MVPPVRPPDVAAPSVLMDPDAGVECTDNNVRIRNNASANHGHILRTDRPIVSRHAMT